MDERVVQVGRVEAVLSVKHPIRLGRHAEEFNLIVLIVFVPDFQSEIVLRQPSRAAAPDIEARPRDERGRVGQRGAAIDWLEKHDDHALILRGSRCRQGPARQVVEQHDRQVGSERGSGRAEADITLGVWLARPEPGLPGKRAGTHLSGAGNLDRGRIKRGGGGRNVCDGGGPVGEVGGHRYVADVTIGVGCGQRERKAIAKGAASSRE